MSTKKLNLAYFCSGLHIGSPGEQLGHNIPVSLLGGEVQGVEAIGVAGVDVCAALQVVQHLVQVPISRCTQEACIAVRLRVEDGEIHS